MGEMLPSWWGQGYFAPQSEARFARDLVVEAQKEGENSGAELSSNGFGDSGRKDSYFF